MESRLLRIARRTYGLLARRPITSSMTTVDRPSLFAPIQVSSACTIFFSFQALPFPCLILAPTHRDVSLPFPFRLARPEFFRPYLDTSSLTFSLPVAIFISFLSTFIYYLSCTSSGLRCTIEPLQIEKSKNRALLRWRKASQDPGNRRLVAPLPTGNHQPKLITSNNCNLEVHIFCSWRMLCKLVLVLFGTRTATVV